MQTTVLAPPTAPGSGPGLAAVPEEANFTCPQYQTVPHFQRVQITGDYASGVGTCMAAPFPWPPLWSLPVPQQCPVTQESVPVGKVSPSPVCASPELNSLAGAVGCCTSPWMGLAGRAVLTLSHPLCLHTALSV